MNDAHRYMQIDDDEFLRAVRLWEAGKDTLDIARSLDRHESVIANQLENIRHLRDDDPCGRSRMSARREFTRAQKAAIVLRATDERGVVTCEGCGLKLGKKPFEINHKTPEALVVDKSRALTIDDGELLGKECCHDPLTRTEHVPAIAKAKRREARHLGIRKSSSRPMPGSRASGWKRKFDGSVERRS